MSESRAAYITESGDRFEEILQEMAVTHRAKAHDYGDSLWAVADLGISPLMGILVRMSDKWRRVVTLTRLEVAPQVTAEQRRDTLIDLANYAILAVVEMEQSREPKRPNLPS